MNQRTLTSMTLNRGGTGVIDIPITSGSRRNFVLMEKDEIKLIFTLDRCIPIMVGDFVDDELFGKFYSREKQMPTFNTQTGGYDYDITLVSEYMMWKNHKLFLVSTKVGDSTEYRSESSWNLTGDLATHAYSVYKNLSVLGYSDYRLLVDNSIEKRNEALYLNYNGIDILSGMNNIAELFECEWFVIDRDNLHYVCFGKAEYSDITNITETEHDGVMTFDREVSVNNHLTEGVNVEKLTIQKNNSEFFNRLYAFGGSTNIPTSYRKETSFVVTETGTLNGNQWYRDENKKSVGRMFASFDTIEKRLAVSNSMNAYYSGNAFYDNIGISVSESFSTSKGSTDLKLSMTDMPVVFNLDFTNCLQDAWGYTINLYLCLRNESTNDLQEVAVLSFSEDLRGKLRASNPVYSASHIVTLSGIGRISNNTNYRAVIKAEILSSVSAYGWRCNTRISNGSPDNVIIENYSSYGRRQCYLKFNGESYPTEFNPNDRNTEDDASKFIFTDETPSGFGIGSEYSLELACDRNDGIGLDILEVPFSWFASVYDDPSSVLTIGENRLRLPIGTDYIDSEELESRIEEVGFSKTDVVESVVVFNDLYPRCVLKVTDVKEESAKEEVEYPDGTKNLFPYTRYTIQAKTIMGLDFPFKRKYIAEGKTLQVCFVTDSELNFVEKRVPHSISNLAGMTFDVAYIDNAKYRLVRNNNYGASLPNDTLKPKVGDIFVLVNWNVRIISRLNLISTAENSLLSKAQEYLDAINEDNFTLTCEMMSSNPVHTEFLVEEEPMYESEGLEFRVSETELANILHAGCPVDVSNVAFKDGKFTSRVIGYELKLDIPEDSPKYTIGETQAYSRLKKLEKEITKL